MRHNANGKREAKDMAGLKKLVVVTVAAVVLAAFAVYVLRPTATQNTGNVVSNEPATPAPEVAKPGPYVDTSAPDHGPFGHVWGSPSTPGSGPPPKASQGPRHQVCVPPNDSVPEHAQDRGANWYRFYDSAGCGAFPGLRVRGANSANA